MSDRIEYSKVDQDKFNQGWDRIFGNREKSEKEETTQDGSKFLISVRVSKEEYKHFPVPREVYEYIYQLEAYIRKPETSKLKLMYPHRFN